MPPDAVRRQPKDSLVKKCELAYCMNNANFRIGEKHEHYVCKEHLGEGVHVLTGIGGIGVTVLPIDPYAR